MASSKKSSSSRPKPPKGRPVSTSAISQPSQNTTPQILSAFSPDASLFAFVVLAVDKHRLRVYDTATGRATAEHTFESGRAASLAWGFCPASVQGSHSPSKKRKKGLDQKTSHQDSSAQNADVVVGLSDGTVIFFSPSHSKILLRLTHPTSTSAVLSLAFDENNRSHLWTSGADSSIRLWDVEKNIVLKAWKNDDRIPCTAISVRPGEDELLVAHHNIRLFAIGTPDEASSNKPKQIAAFTGHATSIKSLKWLSGSSSKFFSNAETDRFVHFWDVETGTAFEKPLASISLDSDVRTMALGYTPSAQNTLITLSTSGKVSFVPIPKSLPSTGENVEAQSLLPRTTLSPPSRVSPRDSPVVDLAPVSSPSASLRVVRLVNGVQPIFDTIRYLDDDGNYIQNLSFEEISDVHLVEGTSSAPNKRYVEPKSLAVGSGYDADGGEQAVSMDQEPDGTLQVDLAELSLGQRLAVTDADMDHESDSDNEGIAPKDSRTGKKQGRAEVAAVPANSLTRTLIQALHSSDSRLLEMCLAHSEPALISNTVKRLPPQLAIPLITACVERLGRGARSANMKGSGGGASAQRGSGLLVWLRTVLAIHTGHLMTIPDLVARLSGLHSTLTARLALHDSLLSLSGRLDMVLSQVELRASTTPASLAPSKVERNKSKAPVKRYVEGDDSDSGDEMDGTMDVDVDGGSDSDGSIEEVGLGGDSEDDDEDEETSDSDAEGAIDGFIDDEAEEEYSEEEEDESE
ncbi:hypothetical protein D9613_002056 [Agrocybe pediades]|uniref:Small-subunit processome Utp12 domain-containing protein n=1 Tax=Agrocybe pediades TaxID=84607 RepID=A0A8H4R7G9_9AGAR|nr:hypothetical protein D9613_002056 [Agrocybe pediades]